MEMPLARTGIIRVILPHRGHKRQIPGQWGKRSSILSAQCIMWHFLTVRCDVKQPEALAAGTVNTVTFCIIKMAT